MKVCEIPANHANLGDLVKVFHDHLYFMKNMSGQISVISYSYDLKTKEVTTKEEV